MALMVCKKCRTLKSDCDIPTSICFSCYLKQVDDKFGEITDSCFRNVFYKEKYSNNPFEEIVESYGSDLNWERNSDGKTFSYKQIEGVN